MKPEEQNKAIAEFCGHRYHKPTEAELKSGSYYQYEPDYLNDLNAMHEAEERINETPSLGYTYDIALTELVRAYRDGACNHMRLYHATAAQRAEALLRTIGKWKDSQ